MSFQKEIEPRLMKGTILLISVIRTAFVIDFQRENKFRSLIIFCESLSRYHEQCREIISGRAFHLRDIIRKRSFRIIII